MTGRVIVVGSSNTDLVASCRHLPQAGETVLGGDLQPDMREIVGARYYGPEDDLPPMRPCCVAKARDGFAFQGRAFFR